MIDKYYFSLLVFCAFITENRHSSEIFHVSSYKSDTTVFPVNKDLRQANNFVSYLLKNDPEFVLHMYEENNYYNSAYSFVYWDKKNIKNAKVFNGKLRDRLSLIPSDRYLFANLTFDSLESIASKIGIYPDTTFDMSHDHLLYFKFISRGKQRVYKIYESKIMGPNYSENIKYLRDIVFFARKSARGKNLK